ncbi:MAG TPA: arginine--tRNA ligase, partial [Verrucomicrobiae bacterium]|nr:arginine--tRNA ligase [Verrucomicrobiae bacterium]
GVAVVVKSDKGTTYLLRDLATFIYRKSLGFEKQLYVVDTRQTHAFRQLFAILKLMGEMSEGEGEHIDYGFIGFKGSALSTRKGNMVLAEDVLAQAKEKVAKIIEEKNPDLANKYEVINSVAKGAIKYYDLSHNRKSDYDFDWDEALDFNGNSGPYLQYVYARLSSILKKENSYSEPNRSVEVTETERRIMVELTKLDDMVESVVKEYQPNVMTSYLYNFAGLVNKFYHESPVLKETDQDKKNMRLALISATKNVLAKGLDLLGIKALEEM